MNLAPFQDFLIACVGASASFIGLLFVALSVVLARDDDAGVGSLEFTDRRLAESAFTALANVFFISLVALMPSTNIGDVAIVMALIGLRNSWSLFDRARNLKKSQAGPYIKRDLFWIGISALVYLFEGIYAIALIVHPNSALDLNIVVSIIIALFATALVRSWQLTGIRSEKTA
jgi:hypothetical protein